MWFMGKQPATASRNSATATSSRSIRLLGHYGDSSSSRSVGGGMMGSQSRWGWSNLVWVIFGPSSLLFATWAASFVTMTRIALGEFDNIYPLMVDIDGAAAFMIIVTYQTLQVILLLNIVISILLDAFQMVQKRN